MNKTINKGIFDKTRKCQDQEKRVFDWKVN